MRELITYHSSNDAEHHQAMQRLTEVGPFTDGMTLQEPTEDCDINVLMKRMGVTDHSRLPRWAHPDAIYGDFTAIPDNPVEVMETLRQAELSFALLPASIKNRFETGVKLYDWINKPENAEEAVTLGLLEKGYLKDLSNRELADTIKQTVSTSTSSDKGTLVPPPPGGTK